MRAAAAPACARSSSCQPGRAFYHLLQVGRTYFETRDLFSELHARREPDAVVKVDGINVAEVYGPEDRWRSPARVGVAIQTAGEAAEAGVLERRPDAVGVTTAYNMSRKTVVEEHHPASVQ